MYEELAVALKPQGPKGPWSGLGSIGRNLHA